MLLRGSAQGYRGKVLLHWVIWEIVKGIFTQLSYLPRGLQYPQQESIAFYFLLSLYLSKKEGSG
jgi:hypothetical protein